MTLIGTYKFSHCIVNQEVDKFKLGFALKLCSTYKLQVYGNFCHTIPYFRLNEYVFNVRGSFTMTTRVPTSESR